MILDKIVAKTKERINEQKKILSLEEIRSEALKLPISNEFPFENALKNDKISFICEVKKASPSKGIICPDFAYLNIAKEYESANADAISVLTEPYFFLGSNDYLKEIVDTVKIPVLRKDFTIDEYMIYEAKVLGASAILLICSILDENTMKNYLKLATSLGLSALVEAHNEKEIEMALNCNAKIIGVNNRNLNDFTVDVNNSIRLRKMAGTDITFVSESGIKTREDIISLEENGVNAVLIGETLMKSNNIKSEISMLRGNL